MSSVSGIAAPYRQSDEDKAERRKAMEALRKAKESIEKMDLVRVYTRTGYIEVRKDVYEANKEKSDKMKDAVSIVSFF